MTNSKVKFLHSEIIEWKKTIEYFSHQLNAFNSRLDGIMTTHTTDNQKSAADKFRIQIDDLKEVFSKLKQSLNLQEETITTASPDYETIKADFVDLQFELAAGVQNAEVIFNDLKKSFYKFLENKASPQSATAE